MSDVQLGTRFAVIDFETTGFSPANGDRCIEVGLVLLQDGQIIDRYSSLMKSDVPISKRITELTGINNTHVRDAPKCEQVMQDLVVLSKGAMLVAHNAAFDSRFWRNEVSLATGMEDDQAFLCTMKLARRLLPGMPSYKLSELGADYGYNDIEAHRALPDAEITAKLFLDLMRKSGESYSQEGNSIGFLLKLQDTPKNKLAKLGRENIAAREVSVEAAYVEQTKNIEQNRSNVKTTTNAVKKVALTESELLVHVDDENISMSGLETRFYANGNPSSYRVQITHELLSRSRCISSRHRGILFSKVTQQIQSWNNMVEPEDRPVPTRVDDSIVYKGSTKQNQTVSVGELGNLLKYTLSINDAVDWESLRIQKSFSAEEKYPELIEFGENGKPIGLKYQSFDKPYPSRQEYQKPKVENFRSEVTFWQSLTLQKSKVLEADKRRYRDAIGSWRDIVEKDEIQFQEELKQWEEENKLVSKNNNYIEIIYYEELKAWEENWAEHQKELNELNANVDNLQRRYSSKESDAIEEYCELVLERSHYPELWQREVTIAYTVETKVVALDFRLPEIDELPKIRHAKLPGQAQALGGNTYLTSDERISLYGSVVTQIMLRTVHELFEADVIGALNKVCINGYVTREDGVQKNISNSTIAAILVEKDYFNLIDLHTVNSMDCYRELGGRGRFVGEAYWSIAPYVELAGVIVEGGAENNEPIVDYKPLPESSMESSKHVRNLEKFNYIENLPPLDTVINEVKISTEMDQFIKQIYNLSCSRRSDIKLGNTLRDLVELDEESAGKIPDVGPYKLGQLRILKSLYSNVSTERSGVEDEITAGPEVDSIVDEVVAESDIETVIKKLSESIELSTIKPIDSSLEDVELRVLSLLKLRGRISSISEIISLDVDVPIRGLALGMRNKSIVTELKDKFSTDLRHMLFNQSILNANDRKYLTYLSEPQLKKSDVSTLDVKNHRDVEPTDSLTPTPKHSSFRSESDCGGTEGKSDDASIALEYTIYPEQLRKVLVAFKEPPVVGGDVLKGSAVIATLEWQWPKVKVGFADSLRDKDIKVLSEMGWQLVLGCEDAHIERLVKWLQEGSYA